MLAFRPGLALVAVSLGSVWLALSGCSSTPTSPGAGTNTGPNAGQPGGPAGTAGSAGAGVPPVMQEPGVPPAANACGGVLPTSYVTCNTCHTQAGAANNRYPDLFKFAGSAEEFKQKVRMGSPKGMLPYPTEVVSDADLDAIYAYFTGGTTRPVTEAVDLGGVVPLFAPSDVKNPPVTFTRDDGVLVTRGAGRVRGRHEGPLDTNQPFMEWVADYFMSRTYGFIIEDYTVKNESRIRVTYMPISMPTGGTNFRAWKNYDNGDVFSTNGGMDSDVPLPALLMQGVDMAADWATSIAPYARVQQAETTTNTREGGPIQAGQLFEFEFGIFNDAGAIQPPGSRTAYYTDTFRYQVGTGGITADNPDQYDGVGVLGPVPAAQSGGDTTNVWPYYMAETQFGQMALNVQHENVQKLVEGRRLFHTDFATGEHSEEANDPFVEQAGKAGPLGTTTSCETCHIQNGPGETLKGPLDATSSMAFKLYDAGELGAQLQLQDGSASPGPSETKTVMLGDGTSVMLTKPTFVVTAKSGATLKYSARIARKVIGMGLLEAIDERTILTRADQNDCNADGISGRPSYVQDPVTGQLRLGRFGWKAEKVDIKHQAAEAAFLDLGVGSSIFPDQGKAELADDDLNRLVTYMRLVSVPGQRNYGDATVAQGEQLFKSVGCSSCHATDAVTSANHPFAELRGQDIKPYSDLLLHDMGPDLADNSGIALSTEVSAPPAASEWRTPPLWGTGLLATINNHTGLLHDGRANGVLEAVLWHGGEAEKTRDRFAALSAAERDALIKFVESL